MIFGAFLVSDGMMDGNRWIEIDISYMEIFSCRIAYIEI